MANIHQHKGLVKAWLFSYDEAHPENILICPRPEKLCNDLIFDKQLRLPNPELDTGDCAVVSLFIDYNYIQGIKLGHRLQIMFTSEHPRPNAALLGSYKPDCRPRFPWSGDIVVIRLIGTEIGQQIAQDIHPQDKQHVLDFFRWYEWRYTPEMRPSIYNYNLTRTAQPPIQGMLIRCVASELRHPRYGAFIPTMVDHMHPIRGLHTIRNQRVGKLSMISALLGLPLRVYRLPGRPGSADASNSPSDKRNFQACKLMAHKNRLPDGEFMPNSGCGDVLVVREDGHDLSIDQLTAICLIADKFITSTLDTQDLNPNLYHSFLQYQLHPPTRFTNLLTIAGLVNNHRRKISALGPPDLYKNTETHSVEEWDVVVSPELSAPGSVASTTVSVSAAVGQLPQQPRRPSPPRDTTENTKDGIITTLLVPVPVCDQTLPGILTLAQGYDREVLFFGKQFVAPFRAAPGECAPPLGRKGYELVNGS